jgi:inorganic pyrophosphatase
MHPWHDVYVDEQLVQDVFPVVVEVPKGSKNKYELDKDTGILRLDRVLYSAVHYPANYGFIPRTYCDDGDALDALVLASEPVHPLTMVNARAIGLIRMRDDRWSSRRTCCASSHGSSRTTRSSRARRSPWTARSRAPQRWRS